MTPSLQGLPCPEVLHAWTPAGWELRLTHAEQVAACLAWAASAKTPLSLDRQTAAELPEPLWLNLEGLQAVRQHRPADWTIKVETGLTVKALQELLRPHGQTLPGHYPAESRLVNLLAVDAPNGCGGSLRDAVLGVEIATADGYLTRAGGEVVKNVTGYDLHKVYVGSHHALGALTAVTLKLAPASEVIWHWGQPAESLAAAHEILHTLPGLPLTRRAVIPMAWVHDDGDGSASSLPRAPWWSLITFAGAADLAPRVASVLSGDWHRVEIADFPAAPLQLEIALPPCALGESAAALQQALEETVQLHSDALAGLLWASWPGGALPSVETLEAVLQDLQPQWLQAGGSWQWTALPAGWQALAERWNLSPEVTQRRLMDALKHRYDPENILRSRYLPLGGPAV